MSKQYQIAVFGGDGIGPEVTREALRALAVTAERFGFSYETKEFPHGSEHYLSTGVLMPDEVIDEMNDFDAILLGAIGDPRVEVGLVERAVIAGLRFKLDLYINLRPIKLLSEAVCPLKGKGPDDIDMLVIRENTEDAYAGIGGQLKRGTADEVAIQEMIYTRSGVERCIRYAFESCRKRNKNKKLTLVDKANAIRAQDLWTRVFEEVSKEYTDIETDHAYVDAACMWMIKSPEAFDTIVTTNLFGDIITDLGAMLQGGMGVAASGNIHPGKVSMFEPIHGSAPKYKGKNTACPVAAVAAVQMMLDFLGEQEAAKSIDTAIEKLVADGKIHSFDARSGLSCSEFGDLICDAIRAGG
ncbi:MAG: 3-isopropylmalate dehydrogenase [Planctomycetota bacterium]